MQWNIKNEKKETSFVFLYSLLLAIPSSVVMAAAILKFGSDFSYFFDTVDTVILKGGNPIAPGWNINALLVLGPFISLLLTLYTLLYFKVTQLYKGYKTKLVREGKPVSCIMLFFSLVSISTLIVFAITKNLPS